MEKVILPNGLTIIFEKKESNSVVVEVMIKVGSNHEPEEERGLAHFMEHILFEGTEKRPTNKDISNEIEKVGGDFNAYTTNERTCFHVKVLKKHFHVAVDVLADILQNPLFDEKILEKEKKVVLKEIDMVNDEPRYYQWILLNKTLFQKHPCRNPTYGDKKIIQNLTRKKAINFFKNKYVPKNMVISIVGDVKDWKSEVKKNFLLKGGKEAKLPAIVEPSQKKNLVKKARRKIINTYLVLGYKTVPRRHKNSYVLDVIDGILGRGQSGNIFTEIRSKRGLAYDVGTESVAEKSFGFFAVHATIDKKNVEVVKELMLKELEKLKTISVKDLREAKDYIEGDYLLELEDSQKMADQLLFWELTKDYRLMKEYLKNIKKVTSADIKRVIETYFKHYAMIVIEGK
ncbi:MAG: insulinase family protein [Nanoarchaeota archaeon]|nr:insulinase family protein [Nanoarchaeota archaeon]MBU1977207.1 insulinase family protein [Nanoarchaeota archaeon]